MGSPTEHGVSYDRPEATKGTGGAGVFGDTAYLGECTAELIFSNLFIHIFFSLGEENKYVLKDGQWAIPRTCQLLQEGL